MFVQKELVQQAVDLGRALIGDEEALVLLAKEPHLAAVAARADLDEALRSRGIDEAAAGPGRAHGDLQVWSPTHDPFRLTRRLDGGDVDYRFDLPSHT